MCTRTKNNNNKSDQMSVIFPLTGDTVTLPTSPVVYSRSDSYPTTAESDGPRWESDGPRSDSWSAKWGEGERGDGGHLRQHYCGARNRKALVTDRRVRTGRAASAATVAAARRFFRRPHPEYGAVAHSVICDNRLSDELADKVEL